MPHRPRQNPRAVSRASLHSSCTGLRTQGMSLNKNIMLQFVRQWIARRIEANLPQSQSSTRVAALRVRAARPPTPAARPTDLAVRNGDGSGCSSRQQRMWCFSLSSCRDNSASPAGKNSSRSRPTHPRHAGRGFSIIVIHPAPTHAPDPAGAASRAARSWPGSWWQPACGGCRAAPS